LRCRSWVETVIVLAKVRDLYIVVEYLKLDSVAMNQMNLSKTLISISELQPWSSLALRQVV